MSDDPWADPRAQRWLKHVRENVLPMVEESNAFAAIAPQGEPDIKFCVELGLGLMLDKPIVVIARARRDVPPKLWLIAEAVLIGDIGDPKFQERIAETLKGVLPHE
jgi:hypothetical protein